MRASIDGLKKLMEVENDKNESVMNSDTEPGNEISQSDVAATLSSNRPIAVTDQ